MGVLELPLLLLGHPFNMLVAEAVEAKNILAFKQALVLLVVAMVHTERMPPLVEFPQLAV